MKVRRTLGRLACAALPIFGLPASAAALEMPAVPPTASFSVSGTNGYRIEVTLSRRSSEVSVLENQHGSHTSYLKSGAAVDEDSAAADFGRLGKISVRFVPSGKVARHQASNCGGGPGLVRFGRFEGRIRFQGEGGYTRFEAKRVAGTMTSTPRRVCHFPKSDHKRRGRRNGRQAPVDTTFSAMSTEGLDFEASRSEADPTASLFFATDFETRGGIQILRDAIAGGPADSFAFDPALNSATLAPPPPFKGTAAFQRIDDHASRWEGPLTVSFPGRPDVALTGRDFSWGLSKARENDSSFGFGFGVGSRR